MTGRGAEGRPQHVSRFSHRAKQWSVSRPNENQMSAARHEFTDILVWTPPKPTLFSKEFEWLGQPSVKDLNVAAANS